MADQKNGEEQERFKEIEEKLRSVEEENRRLKAAIECYRKVDEVAEAARHIQEQVKTEAATILQRLADDIKADREDRERLDNDSQIGQESRDHEMAVRSAKETYEHVEGSPPQLRRSEYVRLQRAMQCKQKYDLSKWKYSELRDTINTSCDIELIQACSHEFRRRLKVYHVWKTNNDGKSTTNKQEPAPQSSMDAESSPRVQRYFRIPSGEDTRGRWYAHFDGQYVARLIEMLPDKAPVLLQAGTDDMQICETLEETGLTRKTGAEILEHEFQREWSKHGGAPYVPPEICNASRGPRVIPRSEILSTRHRYFRIPFVRPGGESDARGWWYAHFDGQYVARQMELHPDKTPVLLQAGIDDMQMCELSIKETGLTSKRGAEILEHEFQREWSKYGGASYVAPKYENDKCCSTI